MGQKRKSLTKEVLLFAGVILPLFLLFLWRQFYGFNKNDEIFYISTVYRFFQGDGMLTDEWNNVQLFAFVTYPLYALARLFCHGNEGIVLTFRIFYLVFQMLAAGYCFFRMRRFGWIRILPALFYFVTTPYNINSLNYNTLAFGFVLLTLVTLSCTEKLRFYDFLLCGFFSAGAVLANPYAILLFLIYGILCLGTALFYLRRWDRGLEELRLKNFILVGTGAFLILILFLIFVFSRSSLREIMECMTYIVMDTERQKSFWEKLAKYFIRIHRYYRIQVYMTGCLLAVRIADRRKKIPPSVYLLLSVLTAVPHMIYYGFFWDMVGINYVLIPMAFPGLIAYLVTEEKDRRLFYGWYVPGLFYTLLAHFATNTGILTVSASYMIPSAASLLLIWTAVREQGRILWVTCLAGILTAVQFTACLYQRVFFVWGDENLSALSQELTEGPLKGIRTCAENKELYQEVLLDMEELALTDRDRLFVTGIAPWMYLNTEAECAAYSTWETLESDPLIPIYYELRPWKLPTVIYCYESEEEILDTEFADMFLKMGYEPLTMRRGIVLMHR